MQRGTWAYKDVTTVMVANKQIIILGLGERSVGKSTYVQV